MDSCPILAKKKFNALSLIHRLHIILVQNSVQYQLSVKCILILNFTWKTKGAGIVYGLLEKGGKTINTVTHTDSFYATMNISTYDN